MVFKILKRILSVVLIIFIISWPIYTIFFHKGDVDENKEENIDDWKGIIKIWDYPRLNVNTGSRYGWIQSKIRKFERDNPGVYIELEPIDWKKGPVKLEVAMNTGNLPDIAPLTNDLIYKGYEMLEPVDVFFDKRERQSFKIQALNAVKYNNRMIAVPSMMTTYAMYINLDLFTEKGVEPPIDGNWTYDEFIEKMKKLTYDGDKDGNIDHYGFTSFIKPNYYNVWGILLSDGAKIMSDGNYTFYGKSAKSGLDKLVDLRNKYKVTPSDFGVTNENEAWKMFYKDQSIAVYPTGSWAIRVLQNRISNGEGFNFAVANYPIGDKRIPVSLSNNVSSYGIFKQENKGKLNMCVKFLKFLTQDKYQRELNELGMFPVKRNITDLYEDNPLMRKFEDSLSYTIVTPNHRKWKDIDRILQNQIRLALLGKKSTEEAIEEARRQVEMIMEN